MSQAKNWLLATVLVSASACGGGQKSVDAPSTEPTSVPASAHVEEIRLEGQPNFRDLGGYETADGRRIKVGEVYRSGELSHLNDDDVAKLEQLGIRTVVNFLVPEEIEKN